MPNSVSLDPGLALYHESDGQFGRVGWDVDHVVGERDDEARGLDVGVGGNDGIELGDVGARAVRP